MSTNLRKLLLLLLFLALAGVLVYLVLQLTGNNSAPTSKNDNIKGNTQDATRKPANGAGNRLPGDETTPGRPTAPSGQPTNDGSINPGATPSIPAGQPAAQSSNLANTGPGEVVALFAIAVLAGGLAANRFLARRA